MQPNNFIFLLHPMLYFQATCCVAYFECAV